MSDTPGSPVSPLARWGWPLAVVLVAAALVTALKLGGSRSERQLATAPVPRVAIQVAAPASYRPQIQLYGRVESPSEVVLSASITAFVAQVPAREGESVERGDLLVALDPRDAELALQQAQAQLADVQARIDAEATRHQTDQQLLKRERQLLEIAERGVERQRSLQSRNLSSKTQLDEALRAEAQQALAVTRIELSLADHANRRAQLNAQRDRSAAVTGQARLDLDRTQVRAPFDARILAVPAAEGGRVKSGDPLVSLFDVSQLEVRAQIPERYLPELRRSLRAGQPIGGYLVLDGTRLAVQLDRLAASVSGGRGGVDALFSLDSGDARFIEVGRTVVIDIELPAQPGLVAVPAQAIYDDRRLYLVEQGALKAIEIEKVGEWQDARGEWVLVRSPQLVVGQEIMTTQLPGALTGLKVSPQSRESSP